MSQLRGKTRPHNNFESQFFSEGYTVVAGVDEAGRGCLAGPVFAAAVVLPWQETFAGLNDSKKLSPSQREKWYDEIVGRALDYCVAFVEADQVDAINILQATLKAMQQAVGGLRINPNLVLVDGRLKIPCSVPQQTIIGGDAESISIAAASVLAKVSRDRWILAAQNEYPQFSFHQHKGYGTTQHLAELKKYGPTPIHRRTFRGVLPENPKL